MNEIQFPSVRVVFSLSGQSSQVRMNFESVTSALQIQPTAIRTVESFPKVSQKYGYAVDSWALGTARQQSHDVMFQLEELMGQLRGKQAVLKEIIEEKKLRSNFLLYIHTNKENGYPKMKFSKEIVSYAASINASIGIDDYRY